MSYYCILCGIDVENDHSHGPDNNLWINGVKVGYAPDYSLKFDLVDNPGPSVPNGAMTQSTINIGPEPLTEEVFDKVAQRLELGPYKKDFCGVCGAYWRCEHGFLPTETITMNGYFNTP